MVWLLRILPMWDFLNMSFGEHIYAFLLSIHSRIELLGNTYMHIIQLLEETARRVFQTGCITLCSHQQYVRICCCTSVVFWSQAILSFKSQLWVSLSDFVQWPQDGCLKLAVVVVFTLWKLEATTNQEHLFNKSSCLILASTANFNLSSGDVAVSPYSFNVLICFSLIRMKLNNF